MSKLEVWKSCLVPFSGAREGHPWLMMMRVEKRMDGRVDGAHDQQGFATIFSPTLIIAVVLLPLSSGCQFHVYTALIPVSVLV